MSVPDAGLIPETRRAH